MQLKKMNRMQLVNLLLELTEENEQLKNENTRLSEQLENRRIVSEEAGSIAQAALQLNGIFEAAQRAADDYIDSITISDDNPDKSIKDAYKRADDIIKEAEKKADEILTKADAIVKESEDKAEALLKKTEAACERLIEQTKKICDE